MSKKILMKITSRERPARLLQTVMAYIDKSSNLADMFWLFTFDKDDKQYNDPAFTDKLTALFEFYKDIRVIICYGDRLGKIGAINSDINWLSDSGHINCELGKDWGILMNISDDQVPVVDGFDNIIRNAMPDHLDASLWFTDGQDRVNTQEIVGRTYYDRFKYVYHGSYKSLWCDNEATDVAYMLGKQIKGKQIVKHLHPAWATLADGALPMDGLYELNNKYWAEDEANYNKRRANGFKEL